MNLILEEAHEAGLSPLVTRIALMLATIEGEDRARSFIRDVQCAGVFFALKQIEGHAVPLRMEQPVAI